MPIPSFRHLDDESLLVDPAAEAEANILLGVVREVYRELGGGLSEGTHQEAMVIALTDAVISFLDQPRLPVRFRGTLLKKRAVPDLLVGKHLVVELKAVEQFHPAHHAQLLTYLRLSKRPLGFLVNFGAARLSEGIKRKVLSS